MNIHLYECDCLDEGCFLLEKTRVSDALPNVRQRRKVSADYVCLERGAGILAHGRYWAILPQVNNWQKASVVVAFQLKVMTVLKMQRHVWNLWDGKWRKTWKRRQDTKHHAYRWDNSWHVTQSFSRVSLPRCGLTKSMKRNSTSHATIQWFFVAQVWFKQKYEKEFAAEEITSRAGRHQPCTSQLVKLRTSTEFYSVRNSTNKQTNKKIIILKLHFMVFLVAVNMFWRITLPLRLISLFTFNPISKLYF